MTNDKLLIPVVLGTARQGRRSEAPAKYVVELLKKRGIQTQLVDPRDYQFDYTVVDAPTQSMKPWQQLAQKADGFVIVSPEYNHGYPGALKMMLDALYSEFNYKPVAIAGVSTGMLGGGRVVEQLRLVSIELKMMPIREAVYFAKAKELNLQEYQPRIEKMLDELLWYAKIMRDARAKRSNGKV